MASSVVVVVVFLPLPVCPLPCVLLLAAGDDELDDDKKEEGAGWCILGLLLFLMGAT
jgi:hypothetical protein